MLYNPAIWVKMGYTHALEANPSDCPWDVRDTGDNFRGAGACWMQGTLGKWGCALQHQPICLVWDLPCSLALLWLPWHVSRLWLTCCGHGPV